MRIAIDAGHGMHTAGKRSPDGALREFQFNGATAAQIKQQLEQMTTVDNADVEMMLTHDPSGATDVPLATRVKQANLWGADIFLSVHANAFGSGWNDANGIETFVAKVSTKQTVKLAEAVQRTLVVATGRRNRGVKSEDFYVLRQTTMPSVLVECGFMTNREEAALLMSDAYRRLCARAIVDGITEVYGLLPKQTVAAPTGAAADAVAVVVNGKRIDDGILRDGRAYVPARAVGEALGMDVGWDATTKTASLNGVK